MLVLFDMNVLPAAPEKKCNFLYSKKASLREAFSGLYSVPCLSRRTDKACCIDPADPRKYLPWTMTQFTCCDVMPEKATDQFRGLLAFQILWICIRPHG